MDRNSIIGFVLIFVIVVGWMYYEQSQYKPPQKDPKSDTILPKSIEPNQAENKIIDKVEDQNIKSDSLMKINKYGRFFSQFSEGKERIINIENELLRARISSKGGKILRWELKNFKKWDKVPTQLIRDNNGDYSINFVTYDGAKIDSRDLYFKLVEDVPDSIFINKDQSVTLTFEIEPEIGRKIIKKLTFYNDKYIFDSEIITENMETIIPVNRGYNLVWNSGLMYQEFNSVDESSDAHALAQLNGNVAELNADKDEPVETKETGIIDFAGMKTKYFGVAIIPQPWQSFDGTVDLYGFRKKLPNNGLKEIYTISFRVPIREGVSKRKFRVYIGPLDYDIVSEYGINNMVNLGWKYGIRQIGEYFMLPIFKFIHRFVPNYGVSIIIFAIIMKFLLYPLTIQQMRSAQKMQLLAPELEKIREKYKDDNLKQQQEIMKLYGDYGINPAGGCLPMLLQMPILIALWQLLRSSIDLRQSEFIWWIKDLSVPDEIINFGFSFLGISSISGLALLMGITMFFQQKLTITDPRQKGLIYIMPVMFTLMFSYFPSGLNLYYFMFNLLSIAHQVYINKFSKNRPTLEDLKKQPKKQSWLQRKMLEAQQIAEAQGKSIPGAKQVNKQNNKPRRKK